VDTIRVAVVEDHEIFRRGLAICFQDDPWFDVVHCGAAGPIDHDCDVVVTSARLAQTETFPCPVVVFSSREDAGLEVGTNGIRAVLEYATTTPLQLIAAVHAAAVGLSVDSGGGDERRLPERLVRVLQMLSEGAETRDIAATLGYSERTIKTLIHDLEHELGARNRAQAVAAGIRLGII
jgi:DNA-binding NarL/FixJ family response regulator